MIEVAIGIVDVAGTCETPEACEMEAVYEDISRWVAQRIQSVQWAVLALLLLLVRRVGIASRCNHSF